MVVVANDLGAPTNAPAGCRLPAIATNERSRALKILLAIIEVGLKEAKSGAQSYVEPKWVCASVPEFLRAGLRVIGDNDTCTCDFVHQPAERGMRCDGILYTYGTVDL